MMTATKMSEPMTEVERQREELEVAEEARVMMRDIYNIAVDRLAISDRLCELVADYDFDPVVEADKCKAVEEWKLSKKGN